jgi:hypothetical protein
MASITVTPLVCPRCGGPLDGLRYDKVFCCAPCGVAIELGRGARGESPLRFAVGELPAQRPVGLPFWRLEIEATAAGGGEEPALDRIRQRLAALDGVWVAAFFCTGSAYHGDPGVDLTDSGALPLAAAESPDGVTAVGVTRCRAEAERYAELYVADRFAPTDGALGVEITVRVRGAELWILPFSYDEAARRLASSITGASYPASMAGDLGAMLGPKAAVRQ